MFKTKYKSLHSLGSKGQKWWCIRLNVKPVPNEEFYFLFAAAQRSDTGNGSFAIDEVTTSEGHCDPICMLL